MEPKNLPKEFFSFSNESQPQYSSTSGEDIDIDRFLKGNPDYLINYQGETVKKKKLFLANWGVLHFKGTKNIIEIYQKEDKKNKADLLYYRARLIK